MQHYADEITELIDPDRGPPGTQGASMSRPPVAHASPATGPNTHDAAGSVAVTLALAIAAVVETARKAKERLSGSDEH